MAGSRRRRPMLLLGVALAATVAGCGREAANQGGSVVTARTLGLVYLQRDQLPEAEEQFKKVVALAPREALGYANLGLTYLRAGRFEDAEVQVRRARSLDTANVSTGLMLAKIQASTGRNADARATLEKLLRGDAGDAQALYALAALDGQATDSAGRLRYDVYLTKIVALAPANLAVRLKLVDALVRGGDADSAVRQLEEVRRLPPEPPKEARQYLERSLQSLRARRIADAQSPLARFSHLMELTPAYQASLEAVKGPEGAMVGRPVLTFSPNFSVVQRAQQRGGQKGGEIRDAVTFVDASLEAGLPVTPAGGAGPTPSGAGTTSGGATALAIGDYDGDGADDLFASLASTDGRPGAAHLFHAAGGKFVDVTAKSGIALSAGAIYAIFADYDNDGHLDLFVIGGDGRGHLFRNLGNGKFEDVTAKAGLGDVAQVRKALFVDLDHDGDLDLITVGSGGVRAWRNNFDGTFTEVTRDFGLADAGGARDVAFADFDGDGRVDLFVTNENRSNVLYRNAGASHFVDVTAASGLATAGGSGAVAVGDFNNDGFLDLFVASVDGGESALWLNRGDGTFTRDRHSAAALAPLRSLTALGAQFVDYDNDGWLDLVVVGEPRVNGRRGVFLFRNDGRGRFEDRSRLLPAGARSAGAIATSDIGRDGDEDVLIAGHSAGVQLLRNDGGNANLFVEVRLMGLRTGSGKNNDFGIGARIEMRAGELYQTRVVTGRITHFGLGSHLKADVLRVEWPNGVPQTIYFPGSDQDVLENEVLKSSCGFLYTWDGKGFRFATDVMWRSALGMPLGIMGSTSAYAPAGASQEFLRIPGSALQPRDGRYTLQLTEELWETSYTDEVRLLAVDHPDSVDVFVDERFVPPGPVALRLFQAVRPRAPVSATDERGGDVLAALRAKDDVYVSNLTPLAYQGLVESHDLVLDLGDDAGRDGSFLFLRGWIYPTDASINVALSQQSLLKARMPSLEVRDANGRWRTAIADIGFPSGKDKTIVVDLAGKFPSRDHHVRIRTNMQIYWDQAFVADDAAKSPVRVTPLILVSADLHFRGLSRMYRKGGRYGPQWFAYDDVSKEPAWRPIEGALTRFGDVAQLLEKADDRYVVMGPGDETTLQFAAAASPALPPGWRRDFLLYTDGWIKDADLNTALGNTVGPLPFHAIRQYPYASGESYPDDSTHRQYLRQYNTRVVKRR